MLCPKLVFLLLMAINLTIESSNGKNVGPDHKFKPFPWQIGVLHKTIRNRLCGGSILNELYIITSANCVHQHDAENLLILLQDDFEHDRVVTAEPRFFIGIQNRIPVVERIVHPDFKSEDLSADLALLKIGEELSFSKKVMPVCLPDRKTLSYEGHLATQSGLGTLPVFGGPHLSLFPVDNLLIVANSKCGLGEIEGGKMCAGTRFFRFTQCQADEGGSLTLRFNDQAILIGIVSANNSCPTTNELTGEQSYGIYSRITHYLDWITNNTRGILTCVPYRTFSDHQFQNYR